MLCVSQRWFDLYFYTAFLVRYFLIMATSFLQKNIPVLTDVILQEQPLPASETADIQPAVITIPVQTPAAPAEQTPEVDWSQWKTEITENVLQTLLSQMDQQITHTIETQVNAIVTQLSTTLTAQLKTNIEEALQKSVTQAIEEEMQKFKN